jgi:hypothetical protein
LYRTRVSTKPTLCELVTYMFGCLIINADWFD